MTMESSPLRNMADIRAVEAIPLENRYAHRSIYEALVLVAGLQPDKVAVHYLPSASVGDDAETLTYRELLAGVNQTANMLRSLGLESDKVISVLTPNLPQTLLAVFGGAASGIVNMLNPYLDTSHLASIMNEVGTRLLLAPGAAIDEEIHRKALALQQQVPTLEFVIWIGGGNPQSDFDQLLERFPGEQLSHERLPQEHEIATYFHTGGTTGAPKIAPLTHGNEAYVVWALKFVPGLDEHDVVMSGMPWFHGGGLFINTVAPLCAGAAVVVLGPWGYRHQRAIVDFWKIVERFRATFFLAVPTIFQNLLQAPPSADVDISSLRLTACGGAPLSVEVIRRFEQQTGLTLFEGYGLTEAGVSSVRNPRNGERRIGSVGIRYPYQSIKTVEVDGQGRMLRECGPEETGLVVIKGPNVFPGYLQESHNRGLWVGDGWLNTGDLGRFDVDGYLWLTGRAKDLIIRGGHNIDPQVIEDAFYRHPDIAVAAALGKPDPVVGEKPVAFIVLRPGVCVSVEELFQHAHETITERAAVPVDIFLVDEIPRTEVGKIFKPRLRWAVTRQVIEQALSPLAGHGVAISVTVEADAMHGMLANVLLSGGSQAALQEVARQVKEMLAPYSFKAIITGD